MGGHIIGLDHVQLAMPPGREGDAEAFYVGRLGFTRRPKPGPMASRGGCWFSTGPVAIHLGVEADFRPAQKAHPALIVRDLPALETALAEAGVPGPGFWSVGHDADASVSADLADRGELERAADAAAD